MSKKKVIDVPKEKGLSSLDGYSMIGIDTDPDSNMYSSVASLQANGLDVIAILPVQFHGDGRKGYIVIAYDKTKDPRHEDGQ